MKKIITNSYNQTIDLGNKISKHIKKAPFIMLLDGDLAAGKTTFTKGIAQGLGITKTINSPTFTILKQYELEDGTDFCHFDFYRMNNVGVDDDLLDYILSSISIIEWPYQVKELLPKEYLEVKINYLDDNKREFIFTPYGEKYKEFLECIA